MKTFFGKTFSGYIITSSILLIIMASIFSAAIRSSISSWNFDKQTELKNLLLPIISQNYRLKGRLSEASLEEALYPYVTDSLYVYVFDQNKNPVLLMEQAKRKNLQEVEKNVGPLNSFLSLNPPTPIMEGDTVIGYVAVDSVDFLAYKTNQIFLSTLEKTLFFGAIVALLSALGLSWFSSSVFSKKATALSDAITSLHLGHQHIPFTGIQEFDQVSQAVIRLQERLTKEESLRRQWMQDISHDLRTPLTAVKMQIEGMKDGVLKPETTRMEMLYSELNHIERLVCNLQDLSRYESPEMTIHPTLIEPNSFIAELSDRFMLMAEQKHIAFIPSVDWDFHKYSGFIGDVLLLQRCISNIIQNAFQHTEEGGFIIFSISSPQADKPQQPPVVSIEVRNSGKIAEKDIPLVFDRLYRSDKSRSTEGNGLGRSIAKAIVNLHKGHITIANTISENTPMVQVLIQIPLTESL